MTPTLDSHVETVRIDPHCLELRDRRTGLKLCLETEGKPFIIDGSLSPEAVELLEPIGLLSDLGRVELRAKQRPVRDAMQAELRNMALQEMAARLSADVAYYDAARGYDLSALSDIAVLRTMPIVDKDELRANFDLMLSTSVDLASGLSDGRYTIARTSGTVSERLQVFVDLEMDHVPPEFEEVWGINTGTTLPRTAVLTSPLCSATECHLGRSTMGERMKFDIVLYLNSTDDLFHAPDSLIRNITEELWSFRPHFLLANPCYLLRFAREAERLGLALPTVNAILSSYQYASLGQRRALSRLFSAPMFDLYTATELCGCMIGVQCRNGCLHVFENHTIAEIQPIPDWRYGEGIGRLLTTTHASMVMPLLRYNVGDLARFVRVDCDCPLSDWQCIELHGRERDAISVGGRSFTTKQLDEIVSSLDGIDFYHIGADGYSRVHLEIIPAPDAVLDNRLVLETVGEGLGTSNVSVRMVHELQVERSMKYPLSGPIRSLA